MSASLYYPQLRTEGKEYNIRNEPSLDFLFLSDSF